MTVGSDFVEVAWKDEAGHSTAAAADARHACGTSPRTPAGLDCRQRQRQQQRQRIRVSSDPRVHNVR